jgi:hypothetical protein
MGGRDVAKKSSGWPSLIFELEMSVNEVQVERKSYQMPPRDGITVTHFLSVADIER